MYNGCIMTYIYIYIYIYIWRAARSPGAKVGAKCYTPERTKVQLHWTFPVNVHWKLPVKSTGKVTILYLYCCYS